jgi:hypothetical protein
MITEGGKPNFKPLNGCLLNEEKNIKSHRYPFLLDRFICQRDAMVLAVKELCDSIAALENP